MSNKHSQGLQWQLLLSSVDLSFVESKEYVDLANLSSTVGKNKSKYNNDQFVPAQSMINSLLSNICQHILNKSDSKVFKLLNQSLSYFPSTYLSASGKQKKVLSPHAVLNQQNDDLNVVKNLNDSDYPENLNSSDEELRTKLSHVSKELANAQYQMRALRDNKQQQEIQILELQHKIAELQNNDMINDISTEIVDKKIDNARYKSEINSLKKQNEKLEKFKTKAQKRVMQLQKALKETHNKNMDLTQKVEEVQIELSEKENECQQIQQQKKQLHDQKQAEEKNDEIEYPFDQLLAQFETQSKEIYEESTIRMGLLDAIQKLTTINNILDQRLEQANIKIEALQKKQEAYQIKATGSKPQKQIEKGKIQGPAKAKNQTQNRQQSGNDFDNDNDDSVISTSSDSNEAVDESLICSIKGIVQSTSDELKNSLTGILDNPDLAISKRVISVVSTLVGSIHQDDAYDENADVLNERNQLLLDTVGSLMKFFNTMIQSEEIRSWAFTKYSTSESQSLLSTQSRTITQFMKDHCIKYLEDQNTILSAYVEKNDPFELENTVKQIVSKYEKVRTNEGKDLLILLHQSLAAGLLCQAYATQVAKQCNEQKDEIVDLQTQLDDIMKSNEKYAEELREEVEKTQQDIEKYREEHQKAQLKISNTSSVNSSASIISSYNGEEEEVIEMSSSASSVKCDEEYIKKLQKKLAEARKKLEKYQKSVKSVKSALRTEILNGNMNSIVLDSLKKMNLLEQISDEEYVNQLEEKLKKLGKGSEVDHLKKKIADGKEHDESDTEDENLKTEISMKETDELTEIKDANNKIKELTEENQKLKEQIKKLHQKATAKLEMIQESVQKSRAQMKESHAKQKVALVRQNQAILESLQNETNTREETEKKYYEMKTEYDDMKQKNRQLTIDCKLAKAKLTGRDDEIKREKNIIEAQWKLKLSNVQGTSQSKIEQNRRETESKLTEFLISVCNLFNDYVDVNKTITCESVLKICSDVAEKLGNCLKQSYEMDKVNEVMRSNDNSTTNDDGNNTNGDKNDNKSKAKTTDPSKKIEELVKENNNLSSQVKILTTSNVSLKKQLKTKDNALISRAPAKEWEDWAIPLYKKLTNSNATKPASYLLRKGIGNALQPVIENIDNPNANNQNANKNNNSSKTSSNNNNNSSKASRVKDVKVEYLYSVVVSAIRLQKLTNTFKSNQDITKTKFKASNEILLPGQNIAKKTNENRSDM